MVTQEDAKTNTMIFSLKNQPGGLARALKVFQVGSWIQFSMQYKELLLITNVGNEGETSERGAHRVASLDAT